MGNDRKIANAKRELKYAKREGSPNLKHHRRVVNRATRQYNRSVCRNARRTA